MKDEPCLLDTHALIFWQNQTSVSDALLGFIDKHEQYATLHVSSVSFWEIALLVSKKRLEIADLHSWTHELLTHTRIRVIEPAIEEMIDSTMLPDHHKDPFDRLLVAQARHRDLILISQDRNIRHYDVNTFWL